MNLRKDHYWYTNPVITPPCGGIVAWHSSVLCWDDVKNKRTLPLSGTHSITVHRLNSRHPTNNPGWSFTRCVVAMKTIASCEKLGQPLPVTATPTSNAFAPRQEERPFTRIITPSPRALYISGKGPGA